MADKLWWQIVRSKNIDYAHLIQLSITKWATIGLKCDVGANACEKHPLNIKKLVSVHFISWEWACQCADQRSILYRNRDTSDERTEFKIFYWNYIIYYKTLVPTTQLIKTLNNWYNNVLPYLVLHQSSLIKANAIIWLIFPEYLSFFIV